jgi:hypothetical protein
MMGILFPISSSSSRYRETGGTRWRMLIAWKSFIYLLDEEIIEESDIKTRT